MYAKKTSSLSHSRPSFLLRQERKPNSVQQKLKRADEGTYKPAIDWSWIGCSKSEFSHIQKDAVAKRKLRAAVNANIQLLRSLERNVELAKDEFNNEKEVLEITGVIGLVDDLVRWYQDIEGRICAKKGENRRDTKSATTMATGSHRRSTGTRTHSSSRSTMSRSNTSSRSSRSSSSRSTSSCSSSDFGSSTCTARAHNRTPYCFHRTTPIAVAKRSPHQLGRRLWCVRGKIDALHRQLHGCGCARLVAGVGGDDEDVEEEAAALRALGPAGESGPEWSDYGGGSSYECLGTSRADASEGVSGSERSSQDWIDDGSSTNGGSTARTGTERRSRSRGSSVNNVQCQPRWYDDLIASQGRSGGRGGGSSSDGGRSTCSSRSARSSGGGTGDDDKRGVRSRSPAMAGAP